MSLTLKQVISGLKAGNSYRRHLNHGGHEYLSSVDDDAFKHDVAGLAHGGWGGSNTMHLSTLDNGRWAEDGWELFEE
ncbi:hypothetical protein COT97_03640 [Candidatus Falkowbacteria bacterium CG10_big_fil_rev_8_21_14_0_10_39_11]|uniref:Uncharacterized protein n=1 Tax=Candidatus Falkowbacteria bacterium CG10_big_fil_rev_8_21_14_0_10_39_11 TaxID=1974565 RepID=A0A2H0V4J4_9BACT|nr:MAG: hypothetical protein COT97_03640 [Candidatus Falkowbacteria bacterium CG10_big_fil_rev_8_21_14_0_10_39_11]